MKRMSRFVTQGLLIFLLPATAMPQARIIEWVENAPLADSNVIALGYPVPLPVDTPMPFDGFRSYAGLHTRHQDLMASSPLVHGQVIGQTGDGRDIWAYRLGDGNLFTRNGQPEAAMLTNGGIHAREWQTPEVVTGIMELLHDSQHDNYLGSYLGDNVNVIVVPVLNVDGFMQTQRYPKHSWLGTDIGNPNTSPRDGRMRRKNMLGADESLDTSSDHLQGVDLNRNNAPYWATSNSSSADNRSLIHHGQAPASEPEIQALQSAAQLGPPDQLALYTDVHSFSQRHFWVRNSNMRLGQQTVEVLNTFSNFHIAYPAGKWYQFSSLVQTVVNAGIGTTDEFFTHNYQVPSWTLEVEPGDNAGVDYGGLGRNGHDGFILPESQIRRVREQLAETFAVTYYRQAGPPSVSAVRVTDAETGAVVFDAEWDHLPPGTRALNRHTIQALRLGRGYQAWIAFDKPMRWRVDGQPAALPGAPAGTDDIVLALRVNGTELSSVISNQRWLDQPSDSPDGYRHYVFDALGFDFQLPADSTNTAAVNGEVSAELEISAFDMTGQRTDANPATAAHWENGAWSGYENSSGTDLTDTGGSDKTIQVSLSSAAAEDLFVVEPGTSAIWVDRERNGEGFMLEILPDNRALVYWYTYDTEGAQDWYYAVGEVRGNRVLFPELLQVENGRFGPGHDPAAVQNIVVGSASFTWSSCNLGVMEWKLENSDEYRTGRMNLERLTHVMGLPCSMGQSSESSAPARFSGTWADPTHASEGFSLEVLNQDQAVVYWFSYGPDSERRWFYQLGEVQGNKLVFDGMLTTKGPVFGEKNPLDALQQTPWGELELELGCLTGTASYSSTEPGFGSGTHNLKRISVLDGLDCP
ncbi:MAG TPA: M14 family zinc carboxypeptidase [Xanthomonadales bacterium]|nr:M14 family zinc carboxypeptidase [Xanthomonadales bacterium]